MKVSFFFFCALSLALASAAEPADEAKKENKKHRKVRGKIVGGKAVPITDVPYQVSMRRRGGGHFCGGSIIDAYTILTAAHCVEGMRPYDIEVVAGTTNTNNVVEKQYVERIIMHEKYNSYRVSNDIAMLHLSRPIARGKAIHLARSEPVPGSRAMVTGYGVTAENSKIASKVLNVVWLTVLNSELCRERYRFINTITPDMICTIEKDGLKRDACQGDSGGPMVINEELAGIISWGRGCAQQRYPGVYTKVKNYIPWIERNLKRSPTTSYWSLKQSGSAQRQPSFADIYIETSNPSAISQRPQFPELPDFSGSNTYPHPGFLSSSSIVSGNVPTGQVIFPSGPTLQSNRPSGLTQVVVTGPARPTARPIGPIGQAILSAYGAQPQKQTHVVLPPGVIGRRDIDEDEKEN